MIILMKSNDDVSKLMAEEIRRYISGRRADKELSLLKDKPNKKTGKGGINTKLVLIAYDLLGKCNEQLILSEKKKKDKNQSALEFQQIKYKEILSVLKELAINNRILDLVDEYKEALQDIDQAHQPHIWLSFYAKKSEDISFATHVGKLTHSSSKSSSVYDKTTSKDAAYLTTNALHNIDVDMAVSNAASTPSGKILALKVGGKTLLDFVKESNSAPFQHLTGKQADIDNWMLEFKQAYDSDKKRSHFLAKQVYFPVGNNDYHLLMPLVSSSIAHGLFSQFKFNDEKELIFKQKKNGKYHPELAVSYRNKAVIMLGRNVKAQGNFSPLNIKRRGEHKLLPTLPPQWKNKQQLPLSQENLFNKKLHFKLNDEIKALQKLLLIIKSKEVGINKPSMHKAVVLAVNEIADRLFDEVVKINLLSDEEGWTQKSCFPLSQQLLLEPCRDDEVAIKVKTQWQAELSEDFSYWLNKQLQHKKLDLTPIQQALWREIFKPRLRAFIAIQEVE